MTELTQIYLLLTEITIASVLLIKTLKTIYHPIINKCIVCFSLWYQLTTKEL